jgi:3-oxoacyl-[acyl-carrier protein] reductase
MGELSGKVALVTGASRGTGRSIAEALANDDAMVIVHFGKNSKAAEETVGAIPSRGGSAFALPADLASPEEIERFFVVLDEELAMRRGNNQLDILLNNAGIASPASYREMSVEQFDHLFAVNVRGAFLMTQAAIHRMRPGGRDHQYLVTGITPCSAIACRASVQHDQGGPGRIYTWACSGSRRAEHDREHGCIGPGGN